MAKQMTNNDLGVLLGEVRGEVKQINTHLATLNGTTAKTIERVGVLEVNAAKAGAVGDAVGKFINSKPGLLIIGAVICFAFKVSIDHIPTVMGWAK